jgi:thioredoxin reductase (NADPH)
VAKKVILIHRRDQLRATKIYHKPLQQAQNVEFLGNRVVTRLIHGDKLTGLALQDVVTGEESTMQVDGVFVSVGRIPASALVEGQLELADGGYIPADESGRTAIPGVFAVGDIRTKALRQIITAAADGANAAHFAEEYLAEINP